MGFEAKEINLNDIIVENNTRKTFDEAKLQELAQSIRQHGVLQPVVVKPLPDGKFGLIAGERRVRASLEVGKVTIPAVIREVSNIKQLEENLIENLQREALPYMETALGVQRLRNEADLTVDEICKQLGKSTAYIYSYLLLTKTPPEVQEIFSKQEITAEVAVKIARLDSPENQILAAKALRRERKDRRVSLKIANEYLAQHFGLDIVTKPKRAFISNRNGNNGHANDYRANWKKYLVRFSPEQFMVWRKWVAGRTDTETLAEATEIVMLDAQAEAAG